MGLGLGSIHEMDEVAASLLLECWVRTVCYGAMWCRGGSGDVVWCGVVWCGGEWSGVQRTGVYAVCVVLI